MQLRHILVPAYAVATNAALLRKLPVSADKYGPEYCISTWRDASSGHCIMKTQCSDSADLSVYEFGLLCSDGDGKVTRHTFGQDSFERQETFDTLIKCTECLALDEYMDADDAVKGLASTVKSMGASMRSISSDIDKITAVLATHAPVAAAPAPAAGAAPAAAGVAAPSAALLLHGEPPKLPSAQRSAHRTMKKNAHRATAKKAQRATPKKAHRVTPKRRRHTAVQTQTAKPVVDSEVPVRELGSESRAEAQDEYPVREVSAEAQEQEEEESEQRTADLGDQSED